ncbi:MAG: MFS transporter [Variibacter sp.]|nr:MFS transporter [Variibacter sp.]
MRRALAVVWGSSFASATVSRITDPLVPQIALDLHVDVHSAALLATAFALPWALAQPVLGPAGDLLGKTRVIVVGLAVLTASSIIGGTASDFTVLFISRIMSGISAAAVSPVSFALAADLFAPHERHVGVGRILFASIFGQLLGAVGAGLLADMIGWRGVLLVGGCCVGITTLLAPFGFRGVEERRHGRLDVSLALANYRTIFANPRAKYCFGAVFFEGISVHGVLPYVAPLLVAAGETRATIAGFVIAGFALGGASYALGVGPLLGRFGSRKLMIAGGTIAAVCLVTVGLTPPWQVQAVALCGLGFGFFMVHNGIQVQMLELAPEARGSSVSVHAFSLFMGQALGPVVYSVALVTVGSVVTTVAAAAVMLAVGIVSARALHGQQSAAPRGGRAS